VVYAVQNLVGDLEADIRHVMEPNTATSLKVRRDITGARCSPRYARARTRRAVAVAGSSSCAGGSSGPLGLPMTSPASALTRGGALHTSAGIQEELVEGLCARGGAAGGLSFPVSRPHRATRTRRTQQKKESLLQYLLAILEPTTHHWLHSLITRASHWLAPPAPLVHNTNTARKASAPTVGFMQLMATTDERVWR
jgi:hypothetical protein